MDSILVRGGRPLEGVIEIGGAKNACLALMPAALLTEEPLTLTNAPRLADIRTMTELLASLGCEVAALQKGRVLALGAAEISSALAHYDIVRKMRASILVLGPLLARVGHAVVSLPGGCAIGARPVDLHLKALEAMGAKFELKEGYVHGEAPSGLKGAVVDFPFVSVGATENALMAATLAKGTTEIRNAAREPEIADLARCLRAMGARIEGEGTSTLTVEGVDRLHGATHRVVADRIELGTYMIAPAIAGGDVTLKGGSRALVSAFADRLEAADIAVEDVEGGLRVRRKNGIVRAVDAATEPFPGFPTDLQAQLMTLMTLAEGVSRIEETIFENRFMHVPELTRMGANIEIDGPVATVTGVGRLRGAPVMASDLRASASLVLAGLAAEGETVVNRVYHLDRGYERVEEKLSACGADIERVSGQGMVKDARFEDAAERALRLTAETPEDLSVIAALAQDALGKVENVQYMPRRRRFSLLLYRFRWEDADNAEAERRAFERVAAALTIDDVIRARAAGVDPGKRDTVLNLLTLTFEPGEDGAGRMVLTCSDDVVIQLDVECVNVRLVDLTRPWAAGGKPQHFG